MLNTLHLGDLVENFGATAIVIGFHEITKQPLLRFWSLANPRRCERWYANAEQCKLVHEPETRMIHKSGLIEIG